MFYLNRDGMERKDLIGKNATIFSEQGKILDRVASKDVKVSFTIYAVPVN